MEWAKMSVNDMLPEEITKLSYTLIPQGFQGDVRSVRMVQDSLSKLIDQLGEQSAAAQGLHKVITTAEKLRNSPSYMLYILKDPHGNNGKGEVIGMLKVGRKHLYLFDDREGDRAREVEPLCVLDFYVVADRQRHGYGRKLFDHMLQDMATSPHLMAVDGPSPKMEQFLIKNYGMGRIVRQNNNFAVSPQFFDNLETISKSCATTPAVSPGVGRFTAPKPQSAIANVIHGGGSADHKSLSSAFAEASLEDAAALSAESPAPASPTTCRSPSPSPRAIERPCTLQVEAAPAPVAAVSAKPSPAGSTISRRDSQLTDKGFFDVKFYHNKLW